MGFGEPLHTVAIARHPRNTLIAQTGGDDVKDRWPSGLRRTPGTRVYVKAYRGFESLPVRHLSASLPLKSRSLSILMATCHVSAVCSMAICQIVLSDRFLKQGTERVSEQTVAEVTEKIYASLQAGNAEIDEHIASLKAALAREGATEAVFDPAKLAQNNRSGRKTMQAYFRQRGVRVSFSG